MFVIIWVAMWHLIRSQRHVAANHHDFVWQKSNMHWCIDIACLSLCYMQCSMRSMQYILIYEWSWCHSVVWCHGEIILMSTAVGQVIFLMYLFRHNYICVCILYTGQRCVSMILRGVHVKVPQHGFICIGLVFIKVSGRGAGLLRDLPLQITPSFIRRYLWFMEFFMH